MDCITASIFSWQCGVFNPCKNCNFETRYRNYTTVDEAVFSPCRAAPRLLLGGNCKRLDRATVRRGHVTSAFRSDVTHPQRVTLYRTLFLRVPDCGFIGETEVRFRRVLGGRQLREVRS
jgi:hypothetical protein